MLQTLPDLLGKYKAGKCFGSLLCVALPLQTWLPYARVEGVRRHIQSVWSPSTGNDKPDKRTTQNAFKHSILPTKQNVEAMQCMVV